MMQPTATKSEDQHGVLLQCAKVREQQGILTGEPTKTGVPQRP
jgi:hypothetical protein